MSVTPSLCFADLKNTLFFFFFLISEDVVSLFWLQIILQSSLTLALLQTSDYFRPYTTSSS
jgi:hypothetical protein